MCGRLTDSVQRRSGTSREDVPRGRRSEASPESPPASRWTRNPRQQARDMLMSSSSPVTTVIAVFMISCAAVLQTRAPAHQGDGLLRVSDVSPSILSESTVCLAPNTPQWSLQPLHHIFFWGSPICLHSNYTQGALNNSARPWCLLL